MLDIFRRLFAPRCHCKDQRPPPNILELVHQYHTTAHYTLRQLREITTKLENIMSAQSELTAKVKSVSAQLDKISAESTKTLAKVTELQAVIDAGPGVTPELQAAVDALADQAQALDDLTPDIVVEPAPGGAMTSPGPSAPSTPATGTAPTSTEPTTPPADEAAENDAAKS
jgi:copper chaperone CopZ